MAQQANRRAPAKQATEKPAVCTLVYGGDGHPVADPVCDTVYMKPMKPKKQPSRVNAMPLKRLKVGKKVKSSNVTAPKSARVRPESKPRSRLSAASLPKTKRKEPKVRTIARPMKIEKAVEGSRPKAVAKTPAAGRATQVLAGAPVKVSPVQTKDVAATRQADTVIVQSVIVQPAVPAKEPAMLTYAKEAVAWFRSERDDPLRHLSNLCGGHPIYWPPERDAQALWCSTTQLYLSSQFSTKAWRRPLNRPEAEGNVRLRIRMQKTAREAFKVQRGASRLVRPDWTGPEGVQLKAMLWVLELKLYFNAHRGFGRALAATGERPIVEVTAHDDFWGAREVSPGVLVGHNHLGRLLTSVRDRADAILDGHFTYSEGFLLA
jgi:predicted NAD-dependent protein-ADP-ribosyltransferase YbiA (DUF1768 family)